MRANEFIFEANMSWASLGKHEGKSTDDGRREDFLDKIKNKYAWTKTDGSEFTVDPAQYDEIVNFLAIGSGKKVGGSGINLKSADGEEIAISKLKKPQLGKSKVTGAPKKSYNLGNVTEGMFGMAIYLRLASNNPINLSQLTNALLKLPTWTQTGAEVSTKSSYSVADLLALKIRLAQRHYDALVDSEVLEKLSKHLTSVVNYVNAEEIVNLQKDFATNGTVDQVLVRADGLSDETTSKVDVDVVYTTPEGTEKVTYERSVKTGSVKQFGQVSTGGAKIGSLPIGERWNLQKEYWDSWGVDISAVEGKFRKHWEQASDQDFVKAYDLSYAEAAKQLKALMHGDREEKIAIKNFMETIKFHARRDNPNAQTVSFGSKGYEVLNFEKLDQFVDQVNLTANLSTQARHGPRKNPEVHITDDSGNIFLIFRLYNGTDKITNLIEKGPLIRKVTLVSKG